MFGINFKRFAVLFQSFIVVYIISVYKGFKFLPKAN